MTTETSGPVRDTWEILGGRRNVIVYTAYDTDDEPEDLSAYTATVKFKTRDNATTVLTITTTANGNGSVITLGADGEIAVIIAKTDGVTLQTSTTTTDELGNPLGLFELYITKSATYDEPYLRGEYEVVVQIA